MTTNDGRPTATGLIKQIAATALPLYLSMIAASAGALVDTAVLGHHSTAALAGLGVTMAVYGPATAPAAPRTPPDRAASPAPAAGASDD
ncbi:hypothetical protein ACWY4P_46860 [Streptomyces sp. LZ34]